MRFTLRSDVLKTELGTPTINEIQSKEGEAITTPYASQTKGTRVGGQQGTTAASAKWRRRKNNKPD